MTPRYRAGDIVIVDWRDALPKEANKQRPAVVVEDSALFDDAYPNVILVPLADDPRLAIADLSVPIEPTADNGCTKPCRALAHNVTATSKERCRATGGRVTDGQLAAIRRRIAETIGL
jgi:mRNA-degrading endonuclease toxin of MazEF toxin-antitoxin module